MIKLTFEEIENLSGAELDYQVALLEGLNAVIKDCICLIELLICDSWLGQTHKVYSPSQNWADGGPIIEREGLCLARLFEAIDGPIVKGLEWACMSPDESIRMNGATPLIVAMRVFLAMKLSL